jgi:hypothetical protein
LPARSATPTVLHRDIDEIAVKIGELYAKERPTPPRGIDPLKRWRFWREW